MLFRIGFTNWDIIEKYFEMNSLSNLPKNDLLSLLSCVRLQAHFPLESPFIYLSFVVI